VNDDDCILKGEFSDDRFANAFAAAGDQRFLTA
jgi:hypothetical protein